MTFEGSTLLLLLSQTSTGSSKHLSCMTHVPGFTPAQLVKPETMACLPTFPSPSAFSSLETTQLVRKRKREAQYSPELIRTSSSDEDALKNDILCYTYGQEPIQYEDERAAMDDYGKDHPDRFHPIPRAVSITQLHDGGSLSQSPTLELECSGSARHDGHHAEHLQQHNLDKPGSTGDKVVNKHQLVMDLRFNVFTNLVSNLQEVRFGSLPVQGITSPSSSLSTKTSWSDCTSPPIYTRGDVDVGLHSPGFPPTHSIQFAPVTRENNDTASGTLAYESHLLHDRRADYRESESTTFVGRRSRLNDGQQRGWDRFVELLDSDEVRSWLDGMHKIDGYYLLAVYAYFQRAELPLLQYTPLRLCAGLLIANAIQVCRQ